jgi:hypothetical protein
LTESNNGGTKRIDGDSAAKPNIAEPETVVPLHKRLGAELIGTFALVFAAAGSDVAQVLVSCQTNIVWLPHRFSLCVLLLACLPPIHLDPIYNNRFDYSDR